ncbi:hypothetical protein F8388_006125 [Cannabis sativa]|uniref:RNase H type-1 domain-containing protein n=1 Tax=Cannabis sativa TaxID=3483 RepID=A0A7J6IBG9_CANSA|nr:hypothetical protein F8388_006125 [Cannabis sativa]KAF4404924.1 hypothetical protein G4B88_006310 [Cannabis sativa]
MKSNMKKLSNLVKQTAFGDSYLPSNASPVAKSIWATKDFIVKNSVWLIGREATVKIGNLQWSGSDGVVIDLGCLNPMMCGDLCVRDLMLEDGGRWNIPLVASWFRPSSAESILKFALPSSQPRDQLCWKVNHLGQFTLKSAYWALNNSRFDHEDVVCKGIWKKHVHERLKLFLWRFVHDVLPFGSKLASIFGSTIGRCMLCGLEEMDVVDHFVSGCDVTRSLWFSSPWGIRIQSFNLVGGRDLVAWLLEPSFFGDCGGKVLNEFFLYGAILYHKLWNVRNDIFHNNGVLCLAEARKAIDRSFAEHKPLLEVAGDSESNERGSSAVRWGSPRPARMRCFVDFASAGDDGAVAAVFYDGAGEIFAAAASKVRVHSVLEGELEAVRFGLDMAMLLEVDVDTLFSDNQTLVKALVEERVPTWYLHFSFLNVLRCVVSRDIVFCWVSRLNNMAAHALARWGLSHSCNGLLSFWEVSPHVLTKLLVPL